MSRKRTIGTLAAIGGLTAVVALFTGVPSAKADEVSDLRANNELLQQKLDQIAQTQNMGPTRIGSTDVQAMTAAATAGSFPRSFLIPGTDSSLRVGGQITEVMDYYFQGGPPNNSPQNTTVGDNGQALAIPISGIAAARGSNVFLTSPRESKLSVETRTPTPYGESRTYMEFDWAGSTNFAPGSVNPTSVSDNLVPRLKFAYGTLGGWLVGQANSNFSDADANAETLDFGGNVGEPGHVRIPQIRYTMPLSWAWGGALSFSAETPATDIDTPAGIIASDGPSASLNGAPGLPGQQGGVCTGVAVAGTACAAAPALVANPTKAGAPDLTAALYIPQPWGHIDFSFVLRPDLEMSDGAFLSRTFMGYGGHVGFDFKPGWFTPKDDFSFHFTAGDGIGSFLNSSTNFALETNFLTTTKCTTGCAANAAGDITAASLIKVRTTTEWGGEVGYQHWWMDNLRSTASFGINHHDISAAIVGPVQAAAANHQIETIHANLIWNPVSFVDVGIEYFWGNRQVVAVASGPRDNSMQGLISKIAVRF